jgi:NAD(P)-dependent dehydrogenase (short-subunit alcohol dehydrogenase family)
MLNVLITGCSSGFGYLTALEFARKGDRVFATMRNLEKSAQLKEAAASEKLPISFLRLDLLDDGSIQTAVQQAEAEAGPIDVLVNNAAMALRSSIEDASEDEVRKQFETNLFGTLRVIKHVLPGMRERRSGTIVNLSSIGGIVSVPYDGYFAATKHAIEAISEAMHYEVRQFGVRIVIIEPGGFPTELRNNAFHAAKANESSAYHKSAQRFEKANDSRLRAPEGVRQDPADVARVIYDAIHDETPKLRYIVGPDAQLIAAVRKQLDFEGFEQAMRQTLDWHE